MKLITNALHHSQVCELRGGSGTADPGHPPPHPPSPTPTPHHTQQHQLRPSSTNTNINPTNNQPTPTHPNPTPTPPNQLHPTPTPHKPHPTQTPTPPTQPTNPTNPTNTQQQHQPAPEQHQYGSTCGKCIDSQEGRAEYASNSQEGRAGHGIISQECRAEGKGSITRKPRQAAHSDTEAVASCRSSLDHHRVTTTTTNDTADAKDTRVTVRGARIRTTPSLSSGACGLASQLRGG